MVRLSDDGPRGPRTWPARWGTPRQSSSQFHSQACARPARPVLEGKPVDFATSFLLKTFKRYVHPHGRGRLRRKNGRCVRRLDSRHRQPRIHCAEHFKQTPPGARHRRRPWSREDRGRPARAAQRGSATAGHDRREVRQIWLHIDCDSGGNGAPSAASGRRSRRSCPHSLRLCRDA